MKNRDKGFTLVELMVVVTIIILMAGSSIAAYFRFSQRQAALNDGRNFSTMMRKIQALAKNLVYPASCSELSGYTLEAKGGIDCESCQVVSAYANCKEGKRYVVTDEKVLSKAFFTNDLSINFKAGSGSIDPYGTFVLSNNVDTANQIVVVTDENGVINVEEKIINP